MGAHERFCENEIAVFYRIHYATAGLRLNVNADCAKRQFTLKRAT